PLDRPWTHLRRAVHVRAGRGRARGLARSGGAPPVLAIDEGILLEDRRCAAAGHAPQRDRRRPDLPSAGRGRDRPGVEGMGAAFASAAAAPEISARAFDARLAAAERMAAEGQLRPSKDGMDAVRRTIGLPAVVRLSAQPIVIGPDRFLDALGGATANDFRAAR